MKDAYMYHFQTKTNQLVRHSSTINANII